MPELWGMRSTPLLPSLPGSLNCILIKWPIRSWYTIKKKKNLYFLFLSIFYLWNKNSYTLSNEESWTWCQKIKFLFFEELLWFLTWLYYACGVVIHVNPPLIFDIQVAELLLMKKWNATLSSANLNSCCVITLTLGLMPLGKGVNSLILPHLEVK